MLVAKNSGQVQSPQAFLAERLVSRWAELAIEVLVVTDSHRDTSTGETYSITPHVLEKIARLIRHIPGMSRYSLPRLQYRAWVSGAVAAFDSFSPDVVITFSNPFFLNIVGYALFSSRPSAKWVAHYSDPIIDSPYKPISNAERRRLLSHEAAVLATAHKVVFCNEALEKSTLEKHERYRTRISTSVIPHSFDEQSFSGVAEVVDTAVIRHVGSIYGARSIEPLLDPLTELHTHREGNFTFELVGSQMLSRQPILGAKQSQPQIPWLVEIPPVSKEESVSMIRTAPLLCVLDAAAGPHVFLPSKIVEYVASKRPVIVYSVPNSPSWDIGREFGFYLADIRNRQAVSETTAEALDNFRNWEPSLKGVDRFASLSVARSWLETIGDLS